MLKPLQHMYTGKTMRDLHRKIMATLQLLKYTKIILHNSTTLSTSDHCNILPNKSKWCLPVYPEKDTSCQAMCQTPQQKLKMSYVLMFHSLEPPLAVYSASERKVLQIIQSTIQIPCCQNPWTRGSRKLWTPGVTCPSQTKESLGTPHEPDSIIPYDITGG